MAGREPSQPPVSHVSPALAGLMCKCPACGQGNVFDGLLRLASRCEACGADFRQADTGDGAAIFTMLIVGFIVVPLALVVELAVSPPLFVHLVMWLPLGTILSLIVMRPLKSLMFAMQYHHKGLQGRLDDKG